jgi:hypothetical protein
VARRPPSELSRLAAASHPPALGEKREPLPPPRAGGLRAEPELDFTAHPPLGFIPSPVSHTGRSSSFGDLFTFLLDLYAPYASLGPKREAPPRIGAPPRGRQRPSPKPNTLSTALSSGWRQGVTPPRRQPPLREAAGRHAPERPASQPQPPFARRGGPAG